METPRFWQLHLHSETALRRMAYPKSLLSIDMLSRWKNHNGFNPENDRIACLVIPAIWIKNQPSMHCKY